MKDYLNSLESEFKDHANLTIAAHQSAYLRDQFQFYGIKTEKRRALQKPFLEKEYLPPKKVINKLINTLWLKPEREYHYFAQELLFKYAHKLEKEDMALLEYMVTHQSWWDTVDFIATKLMGHYFIIYPEKQEAYVNKWVDSNNIWLQRSALLFQLKYKDELNTKLLSQIITSLLGSKEFFINKAIGWILREYSRTDPKWVLTYINRTELSPLSRKEALRLINKKL